MVAIVFYSQCREQGLKWYKCWTSINSLLLKPEILIFLQLTDYMARFWQLAM